MGSVFGRSDGRSDGKVYVCHTARLEGDFPTMKTCTITRLAEAEANKVVAELNSVDRCRAWTSRTGLAWYERWNPFSNSFDSDYALDHYRWAIAEQRKLEEIMAVLAESETSTTNTTGAKPSAKS